MKSYCQILIVLSLLLLFNECKRKDDDINPKPLIPAVNIVSINLPFDKNPSGNWQIGYSKNDTIAMTQFQLSTFADTSYNNRIVASDSWTIRILSLPRSKQD
jgi:hypothetical protein